MGLVAHLSGEENFQETVDSIVGEIKACSPLIIRLNKRAVNAHLGLDFKQALSGVSDLFLNTLMKTEDTLEGIKSFEEKRRPLWKNR
jgi:cyclohexa-1,5-dienecarbonyl-CoA hydratase